MPDPLAPLRLRRANRDQVTPVPAYLDALLPDDHLARLLWQAVEQLDLSAFAAGLKVVEGGPGRAAADPAVLVALWLYATTQGVTSARALARLCVEHVAYIWLCGGVTVNYHTLSDFRVAHADALDGLLTQVLGRLRHAGLGRLRPRRPGRRAGAGQRRGGLLPPPGDAGEVRWPRPRRCWRRCAPARSRPTTSRRRPGSGPRANGPPASARRG